MKKFLLSLTTALCLNATQLTAQQAAYSFSQSTETYANLTDATLLSEKDWDDFSVFPLKMPFSFSYFGQSFDTIYAMGGFDGFVYDTGVFGTYELSTFDNAMKDVSGTATISYEVSGSSPNRILKIQTLNAGFESDDTDADYANVQLWLYETSHIIEIHYGPFSIANSGTFPFSSCAGPTVGLEKDQTTYYMLSGDASNPTASATVPSICVMGAPPENKVYRFTPTVSGIHEATNSIPVTIYPNPSNGSFTIATASNAYLSEQTVVSIKNALGQEVCREQVSLGSSGQTIHTHLPAGMYFVQIGNEKNYTVKKVIIE
jgi:hypothetical protein